MDRIRPIDLERMNLPVSLRGYNRDAVDDLLQQCSGEIETLLGEIKTLQEHIERQRAQVEAFHAKEETLTKALMLAQKAADDTRASAHKEAELILREAKRKAEDVEREMMQQLSSARAELEAVRQDKKNFVAEFRNLLEMQLRSVGDKNPALSLVESYTPSPVAVPG